MDTLHRASPLKFFLLTFALSSPFWLVDAVTDVQLSPNLPLSALIFLVPVIAASILVYTQSGATGVAKLLRRSFDYKRIRAKVWYGPIILLPPGIYAMTYVVMRMMGLPLPTVQFPVLAALGTFFAYVVAALTEELGWTGYALEPMQERWNALQASIILGSVWALFHLVPLVQHGRSVGWIAWWSLSTVALRILFVWLYNNAGKSIFAVVLFHAMINLSSVGPFLDFGPEGYPYNAQLISALLTAFVAAIVTAVWGPRTLARHRSRIWAGRAASGLLRA